MLEIFINYGSLAGGALATLTGGICIATNSRTSTHKHIYFMVLLFFLTDVAGYVMNLYDINNVPFYNVMMLVQSGFILKLTRDQISVPGHRTIFNYAAVITLIFYSCNLCFMQGIHQLNNYSFLTFSLAIAVTSYLLLLELFSNPEIPPFRNPWGWFAIANMIQYAGSIPVWTIYILIPSEVTLIYKMFSIVTALFIVWYFLLTTGLIWTQKK